VVIKRREWQRVMPSRLGVLLHKKVRREKKNSKTEKEEGNIRVWVGTSLQEH